MNIVWPVNCLFGTVPTLWFYFRFGPLAARGVKISSDKPSRNSTPYPVMIAKSAMPCGAGCTLGDIMAEGLALAFPVIAV